jgi:DamX protein
MQNEATELEADEQPKYLLRSVIFLAIAALALIASSYIWHSPYLPSSMDFADYDEDLKPIVEIIQPLPSFVSRIPAEEMILVSQLIDINHELASQASKIAPWYLSAVNQPVQPSPRRIVDVKLDEEPFDDSLVVRDRVVVIPKTIPLSQAKPTTQVVQLIPQVSKNQTAQDGVKSKPFTIQLMASFKEEDLRRFVHKHSIKGIKITLTQRDKLNWYVLTLGEFQQKEQARAAIKNLPSELALFQPWVRPTADLYGLG